MRQRAAVTASATATNVWEAPLARLTLGLTLAVVAAASESLAVATIMPTTTAQLGGLALYGWAFSAFMLANLVAISVGGAQSDRSGPAPVFLAGTMLFVAGLVVSGLAASMPMLVAGRSLQGFGAGLLSAVTYAAIAQAYALDAQPRMLATLSSAWVVPGLVGPGLAGLVAEHSSWRWVFLGSIPLPLVAAMLALPALRRLPRIVASGKSGGRTWLSLELGVGASMALVGVGLHRWQWALPLAISGAVVSIHALRRLLPSGTLVARAGLPAAIATMALLNFAFFGTEAFLPLALTQVRRAPVLLSGASLTAAALSWTVGAWLPVRLAERIRRRAIVFAGLGVLGFGLLGSLSLLWPGVPPALAVAAWGVAGLGMGLAFATTAAAILEAAAPGEAGLASASLQLAQVLGAALATGAGGAIVASPFAGEPPTTGIGAIDLLMLAAIALAMVAARRAGRAELQ
jgi:MFS family permease